MVKSGEPEGLNMAEIEFSVLNRQFLNSHITDQNTLNLTTQLRLYEMG
ncbi:hypothetical protein FDUTEX481_08309 [Tolypothrix sp. PCC 7601]|nr:hypothetical protein FDUTEX481_08309 [Tolypothrix sp. PCC 7601]